jgi:hypothetical protein
VKREKRERKRAGAYAFLSYIHNPASDVDDLGISSKIELYTLFFWDRLPLADTIIGLGTKS